MNQFAFLSLFLLQTITLADELPEQFNDSTEQTFRLILPNHFEMGSQGWAEFRKDHVNRPVEDHQPVHAVILTHPFYVATSEVTVGQFRKFLNATGYKPVNQQGVVGWDPAENDRGQPTTSFRTSIEFSWDNPGFDQTDEHPVVGVSYQDAKAYCEWMSRVEGLRYRLPTEAEWECACRAGTDTHFSFGDQYKHTFQSYANFADPDFEKAAPGRGLMQWLIDLESEPGDGHAFTAPVASYQPNPWGLHDLHGNAWEWCEDRYLDTYYDQFKQARHGSVRPRAIDPVCNERWNENGEWRVIRGGSWFLAPLQCRSATRGVFHAQDAACYLGFRVVREVPEVSSKSAIADHEKSESALSRLQALAIETREYNHERFLRFTFNSEQLNEEILKLLTDLNYEVDVTIRPPGEIDSNMISRFAQIKKLVGFNLATRCGDLNESTFSLLAKHTNLIRLQITGTGDLADQHLFKHLADAKHLTEMSLQGQGITDQGLAQLAALKELKTLHISSTAAKGETLDRFQESPLEQISIRSLTDKGAIKLAGFPTLRHLSCESSPLTIDGLSHLINLDRLYYLNLVGCDQLSDQDISLIADLPILQQLHLQDTAAGDRTLAALAESRFLKTLSIGGKYLTDVGMKDLCRIVSLQELNLKAHPNIVTDAGMEDFWRLVNLRSLNISAPSVAGSTFSALTELPSLKQVSLQTDSLSPDAFRHLANVESLSSLTIGHRGNGGPEGLTVEMLSVLKDSPELKRLTVVRKGTALVEDAREQLTKALPAVEVNIQ